MERTPVKANQKKSEDFIFIRAPTTVQGTKRVMWWWSYAMLQAKLLVCIPANCFCYLCIFCCRLFFKKDTSKLTLIIWDEHFLQKVTRPNLVYYYLLHSFRNIRCATFLNSRTSLYCTEFMGQIIQYVEWQMNKIWNTFRAGSEDYFGDVGMDIFFSRTWLNIEMFDLKKIHLRTWDSGWLRGYCSTVL